MRIVVFYVPRPILFFPATRVALPASTLQAAAADIHEPEVRELPRAVAGSELRRVDVDLDPSLESKAWDWMIQKVMVNKEGQVLPCDPYLAPAGTSLRALKPGEALPYYRRDDYKGMGMQRHDAYPVRATQVRSPFASPHPI